MILALWASSLTTIPSLHPIIYIYIITFKDPTTPLLQATNYTHYCYYNNNTFFFLFLFLPSWTSTRILGFFFLTLCYMTHIYIIIIFSSLFQKIHYSYFIYLLSFFSRSIHLSNQNLSNSINKSNYVHKFLIFWPKS